MFYSTLQQNLEIHKKMGMTDEQLEAYERQEREVCLHCVLETKSTILLPFDIFEILCVVSHSCFMCCDCLVTQDLAGTRRYTSISVSFRVVSLRLDRFLIQIFFIFC